MVSCCKMIQFTQLMFYRRHPYLKKIEGLTGILNVFIEMRNFFCYFAFQSCRPCINLMFQPYTTRTHFCISHTVTTTMNHCDSATPTTVHVLRCVPVTTIVRVFVFELCSQCTSTSYYGCVTHVHGNTNKTVYLVSIEIFSDHEIEMCQILTGCLNQNEMFTEIRGEADHTYAK